MNSLDKLAAQEKEFFASSIMAPVTYRRPIRVKISNIVMSLKVYPEKYTGWGVFTPIDYKSVKFSRKASLSERQEYLKLFPKVRMIAVLKDGHTWKGIMGNRGDSRFKIVGLVPISLPEEIQAFDTITASYDGKNFWYNEHESSSDIKHAAYLRESLIKLVDPEKLDLDGLTLEEKDAYFHAYQPAKAADIEARRDKTEDKIKKAIKDAGAIYRSYIERGNSYTVEYTVDGQTHKSVINKNFNVESAGICLAGGDKAFDLQSLVSVVREGIHKRLIHRVGDNHGRTDDSYYDEYDDDD